VHKIKYSRVIITKIARVVARDLVPEQSNSADETILIISPRSDAVASNGDHGITANSV
jgi:hypothetical protein